MPGSAVLVGPMRDAKLNVNVRQDAQRLMSPLSPYSEDAPLLCAQNRTPSEPTPSASQMLELSLSQDTSTVLPTEPQAVKLEPLKTPDEGLEPRMEPFGTLLPAVLDASLEMAPLSPKLGQALRLPSFHLLGIAARNPDHPALDMACSPGEVGAGSPIITDRDGLAIGSSSIERARALPLGSQSPPNSETGREEDVSKTAFHKPLHQHVDTITPPEENISIDWRAQVSVRAADADSTTADPPDLTDAEPSQATIPGNGGSDEAQAANEPIPIIIQPPEDTDRWLFRALANFCEQHSSFTETSLLANIDKTAPGLDSESNSITSIKILSHALPCPSAAGHAFPKVIKFIQDRMPPTSVTWINVSHAVHDRFRLSDLPTSPPATPAAPLTGNDYFSSKVFDSAVSIVDYQLERSVPSSPHPAVSPGSLDFSICERYIPPSSVHEFRHMFHPLSPSSAAAAGTGNSTGTGTSTGTGGTSSLLVDRLVELSPRGGRLLFIYPTRAGARTFTTQHLAPILDPIIRSMNVLYHFSHSLQAQLGQMPAAAELLDYDALAANVRQLCAHLSSASMVPAPAAATTTGSNNIGVGSSSSSSNSSASSSTNSSPAAAALLERLHAGGARFRVVHAERETVALPARQVWAAEWWAKQEKRRIREAVAKWYTHQGRQPQRMLRERIPERLSERTPERTLERMPVELVEEILQGVAGRQSQRQVETPREGVEVGVFVIERVK
ncbi:MAG: hypothetical protein M1822_009161 [Bathelium mastoideum]|nr:MAG: hypothetical protein M1822_009161 [Bathelium mastoideum]